MSSLESFEKQNNLFQDDSRAGQPGEYLEQVPDNLKRASLRMEFPPSYILVGVYRLFTDKTVYTPAWDKCKHGARRGAIVGLVWAVLTFSLQEKFIQVFLQNSPRVAGLSDNTMFGLPIPFPLHTYAAMIYVSQQVTLILRFFLSKNIRIARDRAWQHTVESRGKGPDFWQPYVEEWAVPPRVDSNDGFLEKALGGWLGPLVVKRVLLAPLSLYPLVGTLLSAWFKALTTSRYLHRRYFEAKKMNKHQIAVFMEERKWDYRSFGFVAALLEGLPIIGLVFAVSNRIGAAMWAFDLEKKQHFVAEQNRLAVHKKS